MNVLKISLESQPDVLNYNACKIHVQVSGDPHELAKMFAAMLKAKSVIVEAIINMDNVKTISSTSNN